RRLLRVVEPSAGHARKSQIPEDRPLGLCGPLVRATISNRDDLLWPGTLAVAQLVSAMKMAAPSRRPRSRSAMPAFVYGVKDDVTNVQQAKVAGVLTKTRSSRAVS